MRRFLSTKYARWADWWHWLSELQRERVIILGVVVLITVLAWPAYHFGRPWWNKWRHHQALGQARTLAGQQDYRGAALALRRATEIDPNNLDTWREVARYLAEVGSPESVVAHSNLVRLAPQDLALRLALVQEAIRFGQIRTARDAVEGIDAASRQDAAFHRVAAALALALGRSAEMETHLSALVAAEPGNQMARFNLAAIRLWSPDDAVAAAAYATMRGMLDTPPARVRASLEMLKYVSRQRDRKAVDAIVAELLPIFGRRPPTGAAAVPTGGEPPGWFVLIESLQSASAASPDDAAILIRWMSDLGLTREALVWSESLAAATRGKPAVASASAEAAALLGDNERLGRLLRAGAWGAIPDDAVDLALTSRLQRVRYKEARGRGTWEDAISACGDSLSGLSVLARTASNWRDAIGLEQVLLVLIDRFPKQQWAYESLRTSFAARRETEKLWQLHARWVRVAEADDTVRRSWLLLSAVLNRVNDDVRQAAQAERTRAPADPIAAAAVAAVLWRGGKSVEAILVLEGLPAAASEHPQVVFWRAVVLAERGRASEARVALQKAWRSTLWPEELEVLRGAAAKARFTPPSS